MRHYEKKGLITAARLENNYREFDNSVVETITTIQLYNSIRSYNGTNKRYYRLQQSRKSNSRQKKRIL
ncbi:MerR family transcriptional regulator [Bacillus sp. NTK034]|uniref:MerR family transcriptional regulator n=1 Tax=Bacillus sp. NTK034 TaxID=2802176 RepID=UPI0028B24ED3|nr:MerR family transcriptional regulator [Bacillus sp. NTK034]